MCFKVVPLHGMWGTMTFEWRPAEEVCSMAIPDMSTRPRTSALRMRPHIPPSGTPIIGSNTVGSCP